MFPVAHVANCFLQKDFSDGVATISPMKMQKLIYCLHGWHLAITGKGAIDEHFLVWPYGPVAENLYHLFKTYGGNPIDAYTRTWDGSKETAYVVSQDNKEFYSIFNFVASRYMRFSAVQLSAMTHEAGTPWSITKDRGAKEIDNDLIRDHFRGLVAKS